jgi:hypothetical protein
MSKKSLDELLNSWGTQEIELLNQVKGGASAQVCCDSTIKLCCEGESSTPDAPFS